MTTTENNQASEAETGELLGLAPNSETYCTAIQAGVWAETEKKPSLYERMLAISLDLQMLPKKGSMSLGGKPFAYHDIDDVMTFFAHAQLRYRVFIKTSHTLHDFTPNNKPYLVIAFSIYSIDQPDEYDNWTWVDDGEDFTKAAAFALKYGLLRHFLSSDGQDEELAVARPNVQSRSASVSQDNKARNNNRTAEPAVKVLDLNDEISKRKIAVLVEFNQQLPSPFGDNYIDSMLSLYATRQKSNQLTPAMAKASSPFAWVYLELEKMHKNQGQCGENCPHFKPIFDRLKAIS